MSFKDHPVHAGDSAGAIGGDALIIGLHDRVVRSPASTALAPMPVAEVSLRRTATRLARLPRADWSVVQHPAMGAHHLVVGTGGVYAVTTTRLVGRVVVAAGVMLHNGHCTDYVSRVEEQARRMSARLGVTVRALLVVDADVLRVRTEPSEVGVASSHGVRNWLDRRPPTLDGTTVFRVTALAQLPRTWR
jgi:hypothetical protein